MAWRKDGHAREDYYRRNPDKKATDDALRRMPDLGSSETPTWNPLASAVIDSVFRLLADWHLQVERHPGNPPCSAGGRPRRLCTHSPRTFERSALQKGSAPLA
jgi:predicted RNA-binding Zn ribbon-like protein